MIIYWLDANIFITAKNSIYSFEINTSLWHWLDLQLRAGVVMSPASVFAELMKFPKDDKLKQWAKTRKGNGLCKEPTKSVQKCLSKVMDYLYTETVQTKSKKTELKYKYAQASVFARGADAWVIAHAMDNSGTVVTFESALHPDSQRIRIPDICSHFGIPCIDLKQLLITLGARL